MHAPSSERSSPIPCFLNPEAGSAKTVAETISSDDRFCLRECEPSTLAEKVRMEAESRTPRVVVAGGDGTLAAAAGVLVHSTTELAILPGGTLNHFARSLGISERPDEALEIAATGSVRKTDVGYVNDRIFLNTSSVGVYVSFVKVREQLEDWLGYHLASLVAGIRILARLPIYSIDLDINGESTRYYTPVVFVGIGERELGFPALGERVENGEPGLHALIVKTESRGRLLVLALAAALRGTQHAVESSFMESCMVQSTTIDLRDAYPTMAIDGEITRLATPLFYRFEAQALNVVVPSTDHIKKAP